MSRIGRAHRRLLGRSRRRGVGSIETRVATPAEVAARARGSEFGALLIAHTGRRVVKWTQYFAAYDAEFGAFRDGIRDGAGAPRPLRFLEIGVSHGGSLQVWRRYFGPEAAIWGIDSDPRCGAVDGQGLHVRIGSQDDPAFLRRVVAEMGGVDIVLDDGSHVAKQQWTTFATLFPLLSIGGVYAVEDLHASYWRDYGGGYGRRQSFVERAKVLVDDMHAQYHGKRQRFADITGSNVARVTFYEGIVFIRKETPLTPGLVTRGEAELSNGG